MSTFPKVANIQVGDNVYDIKDNLDRAKYNVEKRRTLEADNTLILNKAALADVITKKGVTTDTSDSLMQMANNIDMIPLGDNPAKGKLEAILSSSSAIANSFWYEYPLVFRSNGGEYYTYFGNSVGGYKYELTNGNPNKKAAVAITRFFKNPEVYPGSDASGRGPDGQVQIIFFNALVPVFVSFYKGTTNISIKIDGGDIIDILFPASETLTVNDFYLKCEVSMTSETQCRLDFSLSAPDTDGRPTEWITLTSEYIVVSEVSPDLYISMVGVDVSWYAAGKLIDKYLNSNSSGDVEFKRYGNYLNETAIAVKDDNDIFRVVLGATSQYPMD